MARKTFTGRIASNKMQKTVVIEVDRRTQHPLYKKFIKRRKRFKADTNNFNLAIGDVVKIEETRPVSREKRFRVVEKLK